MQTLNILFLCTGNSCRSLLSEATFNHLAPAGKLHTRASGETCPAYLGQIMRAPWSVDDPIHVELDRMGTLGAAC